jgi:histidinol-phosphate/aromatic aminotransferase/cobyric acid decarboxylase-like protein
MEKHGGQDINLTINLIDDFSVTTNFLGLSELGKKNMLENINDITHYPNQDQQPFKENLINWLYKDLKKNNNLLLGNGASELLDLLIKIIRYDEKYKIYNSKTWKPGSSTVQYIEYERACTNYGYEKKLYNDINTDITCIINPCNPTGEYKNINQLKNYIEEYCKPNSLVIVDESMQLWLGPNFREDSLLSQNIWIEELYNNKKIIIFIIHSWTKFFCCTGIRVGSIISPVKEYNDLLIKYQVPWSCNIMGLRYLDGCIKDNEYMNNTWNMTKILRTELCAFIKLLYPSWTLYGEKFLSWIWINTHNNEFAKLLYDMCKFNGVPIRLGISGYNSPSYIRIAVRNEQSNIKLLEIFNNLKKFNEIKYPHIKIPNDLIIKFDYININKILCHENVIETRSEALEKYLESLEDTKIIPAIIIDYNTNILIDGHHRLSIFKKLKIENIPALFINYNNENIIVNPNNSLNINDVIQAATTKNYLNPKSTQHMIIDLDNQIYPIVVLSPLVDISK